MGETVIAIVVLAVGALSIYVLLRARQAGGTRQAPATAMSAPAQQQQAVRGGAQRTIITVCVVLVTIVVVGAAALWIASAVQQANSPEEKCRKIMNDLEAERAPATIDAGIWLSTYNDCVARERSK